MTAGAIAEVALAALMLAAGVLLYRRKAPDDGGYGSQGAVILFAPDRAVPNGSRLF